MRAVIVSVVALGLGLVSAAGVLAGGDVDARAIVAREDKETVTVTVTADCTATPAVTGVSESSTPLVIVPGTQSETGTFVVPAGGATITPGVAPSVTTKVPVPETAESSAATPVPGVPASGTTPFPVVPASANISSVASPVVSTPVNSTGTTTAVSTKSSTSSETSTTVESTSTEASASATPTPSATAIPANSPNAAVNNFAGVYGTLAVALVATVALLI